MILKYDGWCRRIDLNFRTRYPYLTTRAFKLSEDHNNRTIIIEIVGKKIDSELQKLQDTIDAFKSPYSFVIKEGGLKEASKKAMNKYPAIRSVSEYIEDKTSSSDQNYRNISVLSQIDRVARLKREHK